MDPHRELRLTIDARLQARVAAISRPTHAILKWSRCRGCRRSGDRRSARQRQLSLAVDGTRDEGPASDEGDDDSLLDRARYGLYPPGSTFKLITAAAALRRDAAAAAQTFTCSRLPDNRVGVNMPGYTRPIRDDVMDNQPHGTIDMHRALVVSCNAYFAQLAVRLGPQALLAVAQPAEISLARNNAVSRIRDTLPQVGYGQGEVVASPLRMAAIAAAIAADGNIREVRVRGIDANPRCIRFSRPRSRGHSAATCATWCSTARAAA